MKDQTDSRIKKYYNLAKPGIVYGNLISTIAGFFLASKGHFTLLTFIGILLGVSFIIGSACVCNNYIDRDIDRNMARTKNRSLVTEEISKRSAIIYALILGLLGFTSLILFTNILTALLGLAGFLLYTIIYGIAKRKTVYSTLIGSLSGSMPIIAGYTAVTNRIDLGAILIFIIMALWQMPHFYAIAIRHLDDYTDAGLMVWPVKRGVQSTKWQILYYIIAFTIAALLLTVFGYTGYIYLFVMTILSVIWIYLSLKGFKTDNDTVWAKKLFLFSLIVLLTFCLVLSLGKL